MIEFWKIRKESSNSYIAHSQKKNNYYFLNFTGYLIITLFHEGKTGEEIAIYLSNKYNLTNEVAYNYVKKFINDFRSSSYKAFPNELNTPLRVGWNITEACNLRCKHCYRSCKKALTNELSLDDAIQLCNKFIKWKVFEVELTGGEPLVHPDFFNIAKTLLEAGMTIDIFTNGLLLNEKKIESLLINKKGYMRFQVSLDGNKEDHEYLRGKNTFNPVINSIKTLKSYGIHTTVNHVLTRRSIKHLDSFIDIVRHLGVPFTIGMVLPMGRARKNMIVSVDSFKRAISDLFQNAKEKGFVVAGFDSSEKDIGTSVKFVVDNSGESYAIKDEWTCSATSTKIVVDSDGTVRICPFVEGNILGNVTKDSINKIWHNPKRKIFKKDYSKHDGHLCKPIQEKLSTTLSS